VVICVKKLFCFLCLFFSLILCTSIHLDNKSKEVSKTIDSIDYSTDKENATYLSDKKETQGTENTLIDGKWKLIWQDGFDSDGIDNSKWNIITRKDNYNNELQYYTKENVIQKNGVLSIIAKSEYKDGKNYTSALVNTRGIFSFKYGRIDVMAKNPVGKGLFTGIWLLPDRIGKPFPEIDIMEAIGQEPSKIYGVLHYLDNSKEITNFNTTNVENYNEYHLYTLEWDSLSIKWYIDGKLFHTSNSGIPDENMYIILNLAIGGNWPGDPNSETKFPNSFDIDYVKIYEQYEG
jgi:beta-glucanase (GH16 family)